MLKKTSPKFEARKKRCQECYEVHTGFGVICRSCNWRLRGRHPDTRPHGTVRVGFTQCKECNKWLAYTNSSSTNKSLIASIAPSRRKPVFCKRCRPMAMNDLKVERSKPAICKACGEGYMSRDKRSKYCSKVCRDHVWNFKRRTTKKNKWVDDVSIKYLWKRDKCICGICGQRVYKKFKWPDIRCGSVDHVIALSNGGDHSYGNTQLSHLGCNIAKHNTVPLAEGQGLLF